MAEDVETSHVERGAKRIGRRDGRVGVCRLADPIRLQCLAVGVWIVAAFTPADETGLSLESQKRVTSLRYGLTYCEKCDIRDVQSRVLFHGDCRLGNGALQQACPSSADDLVHDCVRLRQQLA